MRPRMLPFPGFGSAAPATLLAVIAVALAMAVASAAAQPGRQAPAAAAAPAAKTPSNAPSKPTWHELTPRQQRALEPLAASWDELTEPHKRKWLAISRDYATLSPKEQEMMHSRMTEWSKLSNQQREQARLNFAAVKQLPLDERKAKWEAYQALSPEEKSKLAERAATVHSPGAAAGVRPSSVQKFAPVPAVALDGQHQPRIQLAPPTTAAAHLPASARAMPAEPVPAEAQVPPPSASSSSTTP
jgi:hypothetical protein